MITLKEVDALRAPCSVDGILHPDWMYWYGWTHVLRGDPKLPDTGSMNNYHFYDMGYEDCKGEMALELSEGSNT